MEQALERAVNNGVKNLVVQPTHLMHGAEYDELMETVEAYKDKFESVKVAEPLLGEVGEDAVSYTHLDVYKRQIFWSDEIKSAIAYDEKGLERRIYLYEEQKKSI